MAMDIVDREQIVNNGSSQEGNDETMEVIRLPEGEAAPVDSDCISVDTVEGGFRLTGSLLTSEESHAIVDGDVYADEDAAEAAGVSWAAGYGVATLYVARNSPGPA